MRCQSLVTAEAVSRPENGRKRLPPKQLGLKRHTHRPSHTLPSNRSVRLQRRRSRLTSGYSSGQPAVGRHPNRRSGAQVTERKPSRRCRGRRRFCPLPGRQTALRRSDTTRTPRPPHTPTDARRPASGHAQGRPPAAGAPDDSCRRPEKYADARGRPETPQAGRKARNP